MISSPALTTSDPSNGGRISEGSGGEREGDKGITGVWRFGAVLLPNSPIKSLFEWSFVASRERYLSISFINSEFSFDNAEFVFLSSYNSNLKLLSTNA